MLLHLLLFVASPAVPPPAPPALATMTPVAPADVEYQKRLKSAADDVERLWDLVIWCESTERDKNARSVLRKIVKLEPGHRRARERLGHVYAEGKWFPSEKKAAEYVAEREAAEAKEKGLVRHKGEWVKPEDVRFLRRGLVRDDLGRWVTKDELEKSRDGWIRQDLEWIHPKEATKIEEGLWKCGDEWKSLAEANAWHKELGQWWRIPRESVVAWTTCEREVADRVLRELERAYQDLVRIYGKVPRQPLKVTVLRDAEQYDRFAAGEFRSGHPQTDLTGLSKAHHAFFTEGWVDADKSAFLGMGAAVWDDSTDTRMKFGVCAVRHALGLSYAEALDPSPAPSSLAFKRLGKGSKNKRKRPLDEKWAAKFNEEKKIPRWFRYGAASYVERYYNDNVVETGGDPWWTRKWSVGDIKGGGGLAPLKEIFELELELEAANERSTRLLNQAGLVVAFMLDGACAPVQAVHEELKRALRTGKDPHNIFISLRKTIEKHETELREFAGL